MYLIGLVTITAHAIFFGDLVCGYTSRQKKQLSPAMQLEDSINSLLSLNELGYKRSFGDRSHESSTIEFDDSLDDLLSLQNIGKRHVLNPAEQYAKQLDVMEHLLETGKRSLSPATDFQQKLKLSQMLMEAGR
ncbi:unnamed protein product [Cercopithifilaria johnstoni]|uniref:Uncharacterized protein n=1 Tax=Cercopithifilaria johnstoni TaxID=2874296 RepID=A0A8J2QA04_9BILA|nr:unnamed protein product [Cercopithifilaria johnstoni]